jgi:hypothetical protein
MATKKKEIVGIFSQVWILVWKNWILFKRNISGTIVELLASYIFVLIILFLRYFVDSTKYYDQTSTTNAIKNVIDQVNTTTGRGVVYYYPNNAFIQGIVTNAMSLITTQVPAFSVTGFFLFLNFLENSNKNLCIFQVTGTSSSSATSFSSTTISNMFAHISFPSTYTSNFPDNVQYTIYTQE